MIASKPLRAVLQAAGAAPVLLGLMICCANAAQQSAPDAVFYNGKIVTVDAGFTVRRAFAVTGDSFVAVGSDRDLRRLAGRGTRLVDLHGATVIPGLTDAHDHMYGMERLMRGVDLFGATSNAEVLRRLAPVLAAARPGETVFGTYGWRASLTRKDLDRAAPNNPVALYRRRRGATLMNSAALAKIGVTRQNPRFMGVAFPVDAAGEPTGEMPEWPTGIFAAAAVIPPPTLEEEEAVVLRGQRQRNALGVTSIRDPSNQAAWIQAYSRVWRKGQLTLRVSAGLALPDPVDPLSLVRLQAAGPGLGDHWLRINSIGEEPTPVGVPRDTFTAFVRAANRLGWNIAPHVGNEDIETVIQALEAADRDVPLKGRRWIVEHVSGVTSEQMDRLGRLGVIVSIQSQAADRYDAYLKSEGAALAGRETPTRELLDHGLVAISGSDVESQTPENDHLNNPFVRLHFFVARKTADGRVIEPQEKVSRAEALRLATINAAYATFEEKVKGSIEPGKLADFVVLSGDYLRVPEDDIPKLHPLATYVGGKLVYSAPN